MSGWNTTSGIVLTATGPQDQESVNKVCKRCAHHQSPKPDHAVWNADHEQPQGTVGSVWLGSWGSTAWHCKNVQYPVWNTNYKRPWEKRHSMAAEIRTCLHPELEKTGGTVLSWELKRMLVLWGQATRWSRKRVRAKMAVQKCRRWLGKNVLICWVFLSDIQQRIYQDFIKTPEVKELLNLTRSPLVALQVLKKMCDHPKLMTNRQCLSLGLEMPPGVDIDSTRLMAQDLFDISHICDKLLIEESAEKLCSLLGWWICVLEGHRCLVFSSSRRMLDIIQKVMKNRGHIKMSTWRHSSNQGGTLANHWHVHCQLELHVISADDTGWLCWSNIDCSWPSHRHWSKLEPSNRFSGCGSCFPNWTNDERGSMLPYSYVEPLKRRSTGVR